MSKSNRATGKKSNRPAVGHVVYLKYKKLDENNLGMVLAVSGPLNSLQVCRVMWVDGTKSNHLVTALVSLTRKYEIMQAQANEYSRLKRLCTTKLRCLSKAEKMEFVNSVRLHPE